MQSPFSFYRGSAAIMAADLAQMPTTGIRVQLSGDAHLSNFGGLATPERNVIFDINDFDETLPGPWEWDLKRLASSFVVAMRENNIGDDVARDVAVRCARNYRKAMHAFAAMNPLDLWYRRYDAKEFFAGVSDPVMQDRVRRRVEKISKRRGSDVVYPKLTQVVAGESAIKDVPPMIFHPEHSLAPKFRADAELILNNYRETLPDERKVLFDRYKFVDAAIKVVGVGSVGTRCWIVLLMSEQDEPLFLQLKEASASVLAPYAGKSVYSHGGQRVVVGMRLVQAASDVFLGWTSGPHGDFYVRQLRDVKIKPLVELFDLPMFSIFSKACGRNLARGHARSGDPRAVAAYLEKDPQFDEAIGKFSVAYADQAESDHAALRRAVKLGKVTAYTRIRLGRATRARADVISLPATLADDAADLRSRFGSVAPNAVEAVVVVVEPEREPTRLAGSAPGRTHFVLRYELAVQRDWAEWQTTAGPDCVHFIEPTNFVGPPAPITFQFPAAVTGDGGRTLLPTKEPFAGVRCNPRFR